MKATIKPKSPNIPQIHYMHRMALCKEITHNCFPISAVAYSIIKVLEEGRDWNWIKRVSLWTELFMSDLLVHPTIVNATNTCHFKNIHMKVAESLYSSHVNIGKYAAQYNKSCMNMRPSFLVNTFYNGISACPLYFLDRRVCTTHMHTHARARDVLFMLLQWKDTEVVI